VNLLPAIIGAAFVALAIWQESIKKCFDGDRYTSCVQQPKPFHRRFHYWSPNTLAVCTIIAVVFITATFRTWQTAVMFVTLPGVVFCIGCPTTVDMPAMALAWSSSLLLPAHPVIAVALSLASGVIHERGPVFAAVYALSPWPLLGLLAVQWWAKPAKVSRILNASDLFVGHSFWNSIRAHRGRTDLLGPDGLVFALRAVPAAAVWYGSSPAGWLALALAFASRLMATDTGRCLLWAAPPLLSALPPTVPGWAVMLHVMTFRRMV